MKFKKILKPILSNLTINILFLDYNVLELIRNDQDLGNGFLEFSMRVRNFAGLTGVILDHNKHFLY